MSEDNESETASLSEDDEYFDPVDSEFDIQFALTSSSSFNWNIDLIQGPQQTVSEQNDYPNEAYKGFVKIIEKHGLSNKAGDAIIRWFNKEAFRVDNPLPKSSQSAREYMLQFKTPNMNFQKELIGNFNGIEYYLEYRHISEALRELLMNSNLVEICNLNSITSFMKLWDENILKCLIVNGGNQCKLVYPNLQEYYL